MDQAEVDMERPIALSLLDDLSMIDHESRHRAGFVRQWQPRSYPLDDADFRRTTPAGESTKNAAVSDSKSEPHPKNIAATLRRILQLAPEFLIQKDSPLQWPFSLFEYQQAGVERLISADHLLLGDEMGLGKTIQVIAALRILIHRREAQKALIVAPAGIIDQWMRALHLWAPELRCIAVVGGASERASRWDIPTHIKLVSYESLRSDLHHAAGPWDVAILDEGQKIKNAETDASQACKSLRRTRSWVMTGTPLENSLEDLESILGFVLNRRKRLESSEQARQILGAVQLRRRKRDVLADLPPKIITEVPLRLTTAQLAAYDRARHEGIVKLKEQREITITHVLALLMRLKQICNFDPETGSSVKLNDLRERLDEIVLSGNKSLVFSQFTDGNAGVERIAHGLKHLEPLVYTGDLDQDQRDSVIRRFEKEGDRAVLILSLKAGGTGLNLQSASYVIHFDRWWNPATEAQAEDRAHRMGQKSAVSVYRYLVIDTIEQRIDDLIQQKRELFDSVIDGTALEGHQAFTTAELLRVLDADI